MQPSVDNFQPVTVTLQRDQWPIILRSMEMAAEEYKLRGRDMAQAVILECRIEVAKQVALHIEGVA